MRRVRRFAIVLLALGVVTSAMYATGAFTNLTAQRDANVAVTGDASAYLALRPSSGPNGVYASYEHGELQVIVGKTIAEDGTTGSGVNADAVTTITDVFTITNQGAQSVGLWLTDGSDAVTFKVNEQSIEGKGQAITIPPGTTKSVGLVIDTHGVNKGQDLLKSVTFHSSAAVAGSSTPAKSGAGSEPAPVSSKPKATDPTTETQSSPSTPEPTPKDDGGWTLTDNPVTNTAGEVVNRVTTGDLNGDGETLTKEIGNIVYKKGREFIRKFNKSIENVIDFLEKHPALAVVITAALPVVGIAAWAYENPKKAKAFALGGVLGEMGMPQGVLEVPQSSSPFYLLGALGIATTPYVGVLADSRDFSQNVYSAWTEKDWADAGETILDLTGLIASTGVGYGIGDLPKIAVYAAKWTAKFPSEANIATKIISRFIPSSASKRMTVAVLNILSDGAASTLVKKGVPLSDIIRYANDGNLKKVAEASDTVLPAAVKRGEMSSKHWADLVNKGYDPQSIKRLLDSRRYKADDIQMLVHHGVDFETAEFLAKKGFGPDSIRMFLKKGSDPKMVEDVIKKDISVEDVRYYTEHGNSLKVVKWAREKGYKSRYIKRLYIAVNKGKIGGNIAVTVGNYYAVVNNYCNWQRQPGVDEKWKMEGFCQTAQVSPMMGTGTMKATN